jgi:hypothetical protein
VVNRKQNLVTNNPLFDEGSGARPQSAIPWADKLAHTRDQMNVDIDAARRERVAKEVASVRNAAGGIATASGSMSGKLERDLERIILLANEANMLISEFDVGVNFVPTLVDAQSSALTIRAVDHKGKNKAETSRDHALEVAVDVTWNETGRKVSFFLLCMGN